MSANKVVIFLAFIFFFSESINAADDLCLLCPGNNIRHPNFIKDGKTCASHALSLAQYKKWNSQCRTGINKYSRYCCNVQTVGLSEPPPPPPPPKTYPNLPSCSNAPSGARCRCNICRDGGRVTTPSMVINFLYIGVGSCTQYFDNGMNGGIPRHLCDPVQFFANEPCGCRGASSNQSPANRPPPPVVPQRRPNTIAQRPSLSGNSRGSGKGQSQTGVRKVKARKSRATAQEASVEQQLQQASDSVGSVQIVTSDSSENFHSMVVAGLTIAIVALVLVVSLFAIILLKK